MKKHKQGTTKRIENRRARHDYELGDSLVVGVALTGAETKNLRLGHGQLRGSYVNVKDNELWLVMVVRAAHFAHFGGPGVAQKTPSTRLATVGLGVGNRGTAEVWGDFCFSAQSFQDPS